MRYDVNILWVEDSSGWLNEQKELMEMVFEEHDLCCNIVCEINGQAVLEQLDREADGFGKYDIFFIDYNLTGNIKGNQIIERMRKTRLNVDVLFYSEDAICEVRESIAKDIIAFEGVYTSDRDLFSEKSLMLVEKNARRMRSITNMRGFLTDQTSENDYIINSYILSYYGELSIEDKGTIHDDIRAYLHDNAKLANDHQKIENIKSGNQVNNMNEFLRFPSHIVPHKLKYIIFRKMLSIRGDHYFDNYDLDSFYDTVTANRNKMAHKKLDVCKQQRYLRYYDNIKQYCDRLCPDDCEEHEDINKISLENWISIRKQVMEFSKGFHQIETDLVKEALCKWGKTSNGGVK